MTGLNILGRVQSISVFVACLLMRFIRILLLSTMAVLGLAVIIVSLILIRVQEGPLDGDDY